MNKQAPPSAEYISAAGNWYKIRHNQVLVAYRDDTRVTWYRCTLSPRVLLKRREVGLLFELNRPCNVPV